MTSKPALCLSGLLTKCNYWKLVSQNIIWLLQRGSWELILLPNLVQLTGRHKRNDSKQLEFPKHCGVRGCLTPMRQFTPLVKRVAGSHHGQASDELFDILTRHGLNAEFCAGAQAFSYLSKEVRQQPRPWQVTSISGAPGLQQWGLGCLHLVAGIWTLEMATSLLSTCTSHHPMDTAIKSRSHSFGKP